MHGAVEMHTLKLADLTPSIFCISLCSVSQDRYNLQTILLLPELYNQNKRDITYGRYEEKGLGTWLGFGDDGWRYALLLNGLVCLLYGIAYPFMVEDCPPRAILLMVMKDLES
ncbi:hypothetical protein N9Y89_02275 [bacterium]|nr:hypothetical protein [bacterium]